MKNRVLALWLGALATSLAAAPPVAPLEAAAPALDAPTADLLRGPPTPASRHAWERVVAAWPDLLAAPDGTIPEVPFQIRNTAWFFERYAPEDFDVARPGSFDDMSQFVTSDLFYELDVDVEAAFDGYLHTNPLRIWSNNRARIVAAWLPSLQQTLSREDMESGWPGFEEGMKVWVDMSSLPVAVSNQPAIMVALRVVRIDPVEKLVVFRYMEGTPTYGEQRILFRPVDGEPGRTAIDHLTWFRGYGRIIETLYPLYHRWMIDSMHAHFRTAIEGDAGP